MAVDGGLDVIYEMTLRSWRNTRCLPRYWRTKMGKLMSILILVFPPRSHKGWWARSDLGNEAVCCYKDEYLENVMEREEVSSIFLLMFLYLAFKGRSREHSSVQADWVQKFGQGFEIFPSLGKRSEYHRRIGITLEHGISIL